MPLRDHFHPPISESRPWDGFHGCWPAMIILALDRLLPRRYYAHPVVHLGSAMEIDIGTFDKDDLEPLSEGGNGGGLATALWAPPRPTLATDYFIIDEFEVRFYDHKEGRRLVAAIEIVSPSNKDRPENRRTFVAKCATLIHDGVCVAVVDLVTTRTSNLYADLLELFGLTDPTMADNDPPLYATSCRKVRDGEAWRLETWAYPLTIGGSLPTLPLWLAENLAVPLDLEQSYEETRRILRVP